MVCIGIRREDKNKWERRVAITPAQVKDLVSKGIKVIVQPSANRVFKDVEYEQVGAVIQDDLSEAKTIFGVKEIPMDMIEENKQYVMFSHTIKAQDYNMPLLDKLLEKKARLVDYECITRDGKRGSPRTVAFGRFAGLAGAIDFIRGMGERFLALGYATPFLHMGSAYMYEDLEAAKEAVKTVGELISKFGLPEDLCPFNAVLTAHGLVSKGAQEILKLLPHKMVSPNEFKAIVEGKDEMTKEERCHQIFLAESLPQHLVQPKDGGDEFIDFDMFDYFKHPENYCPVFHERVAPYASVLFNVMYWDPKYPRVLTTEQYRSMVNEGRSRLLGVCDISCDFEGSVEMLKYFSHIEEPFWLYDVENDGVKKTLEGEGLFFHTVDHLPSELPREASEHFGSCLAENLVDLCTAEKMTDMSEVMQGACITNDGKLTPNFEYIADMRAANESKSDEKRILLIGCGLVTPPLVEYLSRRPENKITACSMIYEEAVQLCAGRENMTPMLFNIATESDKLGELIAQHDIALSLLPAQFHPVVARECIKHKKHMATASYISPDMAKLQKEAIEAGIVIINEVGVDPGIDHMSALQIIDDVKAKGGKITGFSSLCGGLAAPECADNPLGYKFSWAPRGVLTAGTNTARFLENGQEMNIEGKDLLSSAKPCFVNPAFNLEVIPNRDSVPYVELYGLEGISSMFRGTLRYGGYCEKMSALCKLGMFSQDPIEKKDMAWNEFMASMILNCEVEKVVETIKSKLQLPSEAEERVLSFMRWLGIITAEKAIVPATTRLDVLANLMANMDEMKFAEGERDMVLMHHDFEVELANGQKEKITSTMVEYSDNEGRTAMSRTVGITCAIATQMILDGTVTKPGIHAPLTPEWYNPILKALDGENIRLKEKRIAM
eukprot:TRINITY_DN227_c1_g1_i1.p1 TRINITY_DN227_c1_g1~~TRINITY_DN227_c1_g1_i1.p1  ORF type:complete len:894 (+),score=361.46 TRINITY_DN227_c1_g1_i1:87-2768(+)